MGCWWQEARQVTDGAAGRDLTAAEWARLEALLPERARRRLREILKPSAHDTEPHEPH